MSCPDCDKAQNERGPAYFRWGNANIEVNGCDLHLTQVFSTLLEHIEERKEERPLKNIVRVKKETYEAMGRRHKKRT